MIEQQDIELAKRADAVAIARMSREMIEHGLGWSWTQARVRRAIANPECNVAVVRVAGRVVGFGIMEYGLRSAHLVLFAVDPGMRRRGVGRRLLAWLEEVALVAGVEVIKLETRARNTGGRQFYGNCGYREVARIPGYYSGRESAIQMMRKLREANLSGHDQR